MAWKPSPEGERVKALKLAGDAWVPCEYSDIRKGDVFRSVDPETGQLIHTHTHMPDDQAVCLATGDAIKNDPLGSMGQWYGYAVPCDLFDSMAQLKQKGAN
jgi:hypothetical protein